MRKRFAASIYLFLNLAACSSEVRGTSDTVTNLKPAPCVTGAGTTTLYSGDVGGVAVEGDQVLIVGDSAIDLVPVAGGQPETVVSAQDPTNLSVLSGVLYFSASQPAGSPNSEGKVSSEFVFESVPVTGGAPTVLPNVTPGGLASTTDEDSLYFDALGPGGVQKLTPPSTTPVDLPLDGSVMIDALAAYGGYVYVAAQDLKSPSSTMNGVIERVAKNGGPAERIVSNIGHPWSLVADASGLYWEQDPPDYGSGTIVHSNLDGSSPKTFVATSARSLALANGRLYFAWDQIASLPTSGGTPSPIATGLKAPGMLFVVGGNVVWTDPIEKAASDPTVPQVLTACVTE